MHISGFQRSKHHQNSTRRHPERHRKSETVAGKGRKRAKFWAVRRRGVRRRVVQGSPNQQQPQQPQPQQRQTQNKWGAEGPARSPKQGLGSLGVGHNNTRQHTTTHNNTTTHNTTTQQNNTTTTQNNNTTQQPNTTTTTTPENFAKTLKHQLAKVGHDHLPLL